MIAVLKGTKEDKLSRMDFRTGNFVWASLFAVIAFLAAGGNTLTIIIFHEKKLRKRPHFLLISLAVADLLVGLVAVPLYITAKYLDNVNYLLPEIYQRFDMFAGFTSIFTLAVIALERMYAIGWPFRHRVLQTQAYAIAIATPWIMAFTVTTTAHILHNRESGAVFIAIFLSTPVVITGVAYLVLWKKEKSRKLRHQVQEIKTLKLTKTVVLITAVFVLTWLPFQVLNSVSNLCISCQKFSNSLVVVSVIKLLQYGNSVINIVIYPFRDEEYRKSLFKMLSIFKFSCRNKLIRLSPANMGISVISVVSYSIDTQLSFDNFQENTRL
ncbi:adenosine receptor A1-like isoform X2 [Montipora foliosa]|uniref:adenosine receptor A1-like isoform X2 n=1 Tax=Montipora foliosa TaxID=591990 RepID=UPI0035F10BAE